MSGDMEDYCQDRSHPLYDLWWRERRHGESPPPTDTSSQAEDVHFRHPQAYSLVAPIIL
jgi:hypothetical protein